MINIPTPINPICPPVINTSCASARLIMESQQNIWAFMIGLIIGMLLVFLIFLLTKKLAKLGFKFKIADDSQQTQSSSHCSDEDKAQ